MSIIGSTLSAVEDEQDTHGINGRILRVNLTTGQMEVEQPDEAFYRAYFGGRGILLHYLLSETPAGVDPLGPENLLVFAAGVLTGTVLPGTGRHGVGAKSPLTGALASGEAGGWWGGELKRAGFDAIVLRGRAEVPVYLWIKDGEVEIRDADHLWGRPTGDVEDEIRQELGDERVRVAQIGPGGENLVRYACVVHDANRAAGRSGLGAVMGSKNLKAIAVRGGKRIGLADRSAMSDTLEWITSNYKEKMAWAVAMGTPGEVKALHDIGSLPVKNFSEPSFEGIEQVDGENFFDLMLEGRDTCLGCPVRCKPVFQYENGYEVDSKYGGPEYETIGALGPLCLVDDPVAVAKANELCEANGLDTISTGGTIAFVMECVEKGLLTASEEDGFLPRFGDADSVVESVRRIAQREGIGDRMAEGSARMAESLGPEAEELVVTTRGQELPMHDPRLKNAFGLGYAVSPTGADHMHNMDDTFVNNPESPNCARLRSLGFETPLPLFGLPKKKVEAFAYETAFMHFMDSAVLCDFYPYEYHHLVEAIKGVVGWDMSKEEIVQVGMRVVTMARLFLVREGFTAEDDQLPQRIYQPHETGPVEGQALSPEELEQAAKTYYQVMGWDNNGVPTEAALEKLGLEWAR
jgi:aldehyde:ferredoxin oxidoreductase